MADVTPNVSLGRGCELHDRVVNNDPANSGIVVIALKAAEADSVLMDYADLAALLAAPGNDEADFDNYTRKVLTDADLVASTVDNTANTRNADMPDQTWSAAGGTLDNNLVKLVYCYDPDVGAGADADLVPMGIPDFVIATNGGDITAQISALGYWYSQQPA